jgi:hypothetical protein
MPPPVLYNLEFVRPEEEAVFAGTRAIPDNQGQRFFAAHRAYHVWDYSW